MSKYWEDFYRQHTQETGSDPYKQVGRTLASEPMPDAMFQRVASVWKQHLQLTRHDVLLDFCCGNGLLSATLAPHCSRVLGVDFSPGLLAAGKVRRQANTTVVAADGSKVNFRAQSFDTIIFAAALQHFSKPETIQLLRKFHCWLRPSGRLLITDILDADRQWNFFNTFERQCAYFDSIEAGEPVLGQWYEPTWLQNLGRHTSFDSAVVLDQPADYWYAHYRFDILLQK